MRPSELLEAPPGRGGVPSFSDSWIDAEGQAEPFLSYVDSERSVNWSDELEQLHEEASRSHFIDRWTRSAILERLGNPPPDAVIADVGCSTGYLLEDLRDAHPTATLIGIDLIASGLIKAHDLVPSAWLLQADACALPLADGTVDAVASANLLEHVPDDLSALREIARVLRPGANAALVVPAGPNTYDYYDRFLGHERRYARGELAKKCALAGLEVLEDFHIAALLYPAFWLVKQRNRRRHGGLEGEALAARVNADIARTHGSRTGEWLWRLEAGLHRTGVRPPFGIRSVVAARRPQGPL